MSKYTMELREVIQEKGEEVVKGYFSSYNLNDYLSENEIETITSSNLFSKERLAKKIINHYYMREIGLETISLWAMQVKEEMEEIMERYLPLYYSKCIIYDPLVNVDFTESYSGTNIGNGSQTSESTTTGNGLNINSNTPQGNINKTDVLSGKYASTTNGSESEATGHDSMSSTSDSTQTYTKTTKGNSGVSATSQKMILQYRENIRALDEEVIEELEDLFFGLI